MMYINIPNKRKKETTYASRVSLFFHSLKLKNKKKIPYLRKKESVCLIDVSSYPDSDLFPQKSLSVKLELKKRHLKRKLSYFLSMVL